MGDEADHLEANCNWDAEINAFERERNFYQRQKDKAFKGAVQAEVARQLKRAGLKPKTYERRGKMIDRVCKCGCGTKFQAREADVKRGWGRFSSKACAARYKDQLTGGRNRDHYGY